MLAGPVAAVKVIAVPGVTGEPWSAVNVVVVATSLATVEKDPCVAAEPSNAVVLGMNVASTVWLPTERVGVVNVATPEPLTVAGVPTLLPSTLN